MECALEPLPGPAQAAGCKQRGAQVDAGERVVADGAAPGALGGLEQGARAAEAGGLGRVAERRPTGADARRTRTRSGTVTPQQLSPREAHETASAPAASGTGSGSAVVAAALERLAKMRRLSV
jgi:hypothetical protein